MCTIKQQVEYANSRGVGQFHLFEGEQYRTTWRSYGTAKALADKYGHTVYNDSGRAVYRNGKEI